jgi:exonuclease VII large subunit
MPHDAKGKLLKIGDPVIIRGKVKQIYPGGGYCNIVVETAANLWPGNGPSAISLNARQMELQEER